MSARLQPLPRGYRWVIVPIAASAAVYGPVLGHYFAADEFMHFFNLANYGFAELVLTPHGGHVLLTSNASYAVLHALFGYNAAAYFAVALATHLVAVGFLFHALRRWSGPFAAVATSTLWGICPLAEHSVGWFGVYGHVLVGFCVAWILYDVSRISCEEARVTRWTVVRWYALVLVAATSYGFGLSIALAFPAAVYGLLPRSAPRRSTAAIFASLWVVVPALYGSVHLAHAALSGRAAMHGLSEVALRSTIALEDLLQVARVLIDLLSYGAASLPFGAALVLASEHGASGNALMCFSRVAFLGMLVAVVWRLRSRTADERLRALACLVLAVACYGTIALWVVLSGRVETAAAYGIPAVTQPLTPRYHYVTTLLLGVVGTIAIGPGAAARGHAAWKVGAFSVLGAAAISSSFIAARSIAIGDLRASQTRVVAAIERAIDRAPEGSPVYIQNHPFEPWGFEFGDRFPGWAAVFVISFPEDEVRGRRVYFVERDADLRRRLSGGGSRVGDLLVAAEGKPRRQT